MKPFFLTLAVALGPWLSGLSQQEPGLPSVGGGLEVEAGGADQTSPLGARQQRIKRLLLDLEGKFTELADKLKEEQPEQAEKLAEAFRESQDRLLMKRMDDITAFLDGAKLESATDEQARMVDDLRDLIDLLLYEETEYERLQREIEQLEEWKAALEGLIEDESELREESESLADPEQAKAALEERLAQARALAERQEALVKETEENEGGSVDAMDKLADEQAEVREATEKLSEEMKAAEDGSSAAAEEKAGASLAEAAESQAAAEDQLAQGKAGAASELEKEALSQMQEAIEALEAEKAEMEARDAAEAANQLAQQQNETAAEAGELGESMAQANQEGQDASAPSESVQNAQQQMSQAAQQLGQNQAGAAAENQQEALDALNEAREEVERQLNELRDQAQQEQIARLEEVFSKMLERQRLVTGGTREIADRRGGDEERLARADRIELRQWAKEERELEGQAQAAEELLVDDGTSVVFRDIVGYLQQEIGSVAAMMENQETGLLVQEAHREIEATLEELVAALENAALGQNGQPGPQAPPGGEGEPQRQSLFPPLAELKLLKFTQERINRQTKSIEGGRGQLEPAVEAILETRLQSAAEMQDQLTIMTRQLAAKLQPTMTEEDPNAID